jgi:hypothetical protein
MLVMLVAATFSFVHRYLPSVLVEPIKQELGISDVQFSLLQGTAFAVLYGAASLVCGLLADRMHRRNLVVLGLLPHGTARACDRGVVLRRHAGQRAGLCRRWSHAGCGNGWAVRWPTVGGRACAMAAGGGVDGCERVCAGARHPDLSRAAAPRPGSCRALGQSDAGALGPARPHRACGAGRCHGSAGRLRLQHLDHRASDAHARLQRVRRRIGAGGLHADCRRGRRLARRCDLRPRAHRSPGASTPSRLLRLPCCCRPACCFCPAAGQSWRPSPAGSGCGSQSRDRAYTRAFNDRRHIGRALHSRSLSGGRIWACRKNPAPSQRAG